ncbi:hypothetical protein [Pontibacter beigongshangensis]|uniref:hypothetical protein n=1 Tax=Pontibacter beigongshangensis TaxID=2574733 RepID=UPI00164F3A3E|nr:hypothetical protein [Pontibacter beigongshangensis]
MAVKIDDKGINVVDWLFKGLWAMVVFFLVDFHNQNKEYQKHQADINEKLVNVLNQLQQNQAVQKRDNDYIMQEIKELKDDVKELKEVNRRSR